MACAVVKAEGIKSYVHMALEVAISLVYLGHGSLISQNSQLAFFSHPMGGMK